MSNAIINIATSFEAQLDLVRQETGIVVPRMTGGRRAYFSDFSRINTTSVEIDYSVGYLLPEPSYGLAFPNAAEVLSSALPKSSSMKDSIGAVLQLLGEFGLAEAKATQPIVSLSGGEQLLLTFAKLKASLDRVTSLIACSPLHSLDMTRYSYWQKVLDAFDERNKTVTISLLEGEPYFARGNDGPDGKFATPNKLEWQLRVDDAKIEFDGTQFPIYHPPSTIIYNLSSTNALTLFSPTVLTGDNGVGKSVFAKALTGVLKVRRGLFSIASPNGNGPARLLFQQPDEQLFGKSIEEHLSWVFRYDQEKRELAWQIYKEIESTVRKYIQMNMLHAISALGDVNQPRTTLQAKICLISERIASKPSLLFLDEPGRRLCKPIAVVLVSSACEQAHKQNVAVVLISHLSDWWLDIANSHLHFKCDDSGTVNITQIAVPGEIEPK